MLVLLFDVCGVIVGYGGCVVNGWFVKVILYEVDLCIGCG